VSGVTPSGRAPATRVVETSGARIAVHDLGGVGSPLLLLHATGFHGRAYRALAATVGHRFHVWAVDLRAHGSSPPPVDLDLRWSAMADDVIAVIDHLGEELGGGPVAVFGHSIGGAVALLAERARPGTFEGMFLFEPIVFSNEWLQARPPNPVVAAARGRRERFASRAEALERYAGRPPLGLLRADVLRDYVEWGFVDLPDGTIELACRAEHEAATFEAEEEMTLDLLDTIDAPVAIAVGGLWSMPRELAPAIARTLAHARLIEYPHLGHLGPLEQPGVVGADLVTAPWSSSDPDRR
jgi:pimeloyl-ACP methyl ester carboxylesterase